MKTRLQIVLFLAGLCPLASLLAADNLFSEVAMESVFEKNATLSTTVASLGESETLERVTGVSSLSLALKAAGFTPKENAGRAAIRVAHAGWNFPTDLEVQLEKDRIAVEMSLIDLPDTAAVESKELLKLIEKNDAVAGYFFAFDSTKKVLVLRSAFENRSLSGKKIQANLDQLAAFAEKHSAAWSKLKSKPEAKDGDTAAKTTAGTTATTTGGLSLMGTWGAALKGKDSIAIQLKDDLTFKLVTVQAGKSTVSKGKYVRSGNQLTLNGDDKVTLQCTVVQTVANRFQLSVNDDKGTAKLKVDFQKSK